MSRCVDKKYGDMLYPFELGLLTDEDRQAFEIHLIECAYCSERAAKFPAAARIIRDDREIHDHTRTLAEPLQGRGSIPSVWQRWCCCCCL